MENARLNLLDESSSKNFVQAFMNLPREVGVHQECATLVEAVEQQKQGELVLSTQEVTRLVLMMADEEQKDVAH